MGCIYIGNMELIIYYMIFMVRILMQDIWNVCARTSYLGLDNVFSSWRSYSTSGIYRRKYRVLSTTEFGDSSTNSGRES